MSHSIPPIVLRNLKLDNSRQFKQLKRRQLRELKKLYSEFECGCAYVPGYSEGEVSKLASALENLIKRTSCQKWGR